MWNIIHLSSSIAFAITLSNFHDNFFTSAASLFCLLIYEVEKKLLPYSEAVCKRFTDTKTLIDIMPHLTESTVYH